MSVIRAQVSLRHASGLAADRAVNTFHFNGDITIAAKRTAIFDALNAFYNMVSSGGDGRISQYLSNAILDYDIKLYDVTVEPAGPPVASRLANALGTRLAGQVDLPSEVAVALSFQGVAGSGLVQRRRRGRVFIGPLNTAAIDQNAGNGPRVNNTFATILRDNGNRLAQAVDSEVEWVIYSRPYEGRAAGVGPTGKPFAAIAARPGTTVDIVEVSTDNAVDTIRRRGEKATSRTRLTTGG